MTTGDRAVSALYVTQRTRLWSMELDRLPNQGQLDTSVPAHVVDLDAIQRAPAVTPPVVRHAPRLPLLRRRRDWRQVAVRAAVWTLRAIPPAVVIGLSLLLVRGLLGGL